MILLLVFLSVVGVSLSYPQPQLSDQNIVGGFQSSAKQFPYQVSIERPSGRLICGGSLIKPNAVLTAAHCKRDPAVVRAGSVEIGSEGYTVKVKRWINHPNFEDLPYNNDIAVIILQGSFRIGNDVQTIALQTGKLPKPGSKLTVTGWGKTAEKGYLSYFLLYTTLPLVDHDTCRRNNGPNITENMFCAGYPQGQYGACKGDSGGPAVFRGKQVGVVSWQIGCARPKRSSIFADVTRYTKWIEEQTRQ